MTNIAYLGTGLLGSAFVEAALGRGDQVAVWNRTAAKAEALARFGARVAATPADAVRGAKTVHLVLRDDAVVDDVIAQCRSGLEADAIIVDHTTTNPKLTAERSKRREAEGVRYLHCPVFIGPPAARKGEGTILVAGRKDLFEAVEAELSRQASKVEYLGSRPDLAAVHKLAGNAWVIGLSGLMADILKIAKGGDVPAPEIIERVASFAAYNIAAGRGKAMINGRFDPTFELTMARKDVRLMLETAGSLPMAMLPGLAARMDELIAAGYGAKDLAVIGVE